MQTIYFIVFGVKAWTMIGRRQYLEDQLLAKDFILPLNLRSVIYVISGVHFHKNNNTFASRLISNAH